jgi:hypothetical protein
MLETLGTAWSTLLELYLRCLGLGNCLEYPPCWCLDLKTAWNLVSVIFRSSSVGKPWGLLGIPSFCWNVLVFKCGLGAEEACDETCDPLLDQGVVEASGSFALLTFALEKVRADSFSF